MPREDFVCSRRLRVRWAEVDMQGVVFNGHYFTYLDTAVAQYWRSIGLPYPAGYVDRYAADLYLRKATLEYLGSARYDEVLAVGCRVGRLGRAGMTFNFEIYRDAPAPGAARRARAAAGAPPPPGQPARRGGAGRRPPGRCVLAS